MQEAGWMTSFILISILANGLKLWRMKCVAALRMEDPPSVLHLSRACSTSLVASEYQACAPDSRYGAKPSYSQKIWA